MHRYEQPEQIYQQDFSLKKMGQIRTEIPDHSPGPSETDEELLTYDGIVRTREVTLSE